MRQVRNDWTIQNLRRSEPEKRDTRRTKLGHRTQSSNQLVHQRDHHERVTKKAQKKEVKFWRKINAFIFSWAFGEGHGSTQQ